MFGRRKKRIPVMKAVRSIKNQYIGINAHLHSLWQSEGGWDEFHIEFLWSIHGQR